MIKHASSHGLAVLVCTVCSALMIDIIRTAMPSVYARVIVLAGSVVDSFNLPIDPRMLALVGLAVGLGLVWGVAFKLAAKR